MSRWHWDEAAAFEAMAFAIIVATILACGIVLGALI